MNVKIYTVYNNESVKLYTTGRFKLIMPTIYIATATVRHRQGHQLYEIEMQRNVFNKVVQENELILNYKQQLMAIRNRRGKEYILENAISMTKVFPPFYHPRNPMIEYYGEIEK